MASNPPTMVCDACGAEFERPLLLTVIDERGARPVAACPDCKAVGPTFKMPGMRARFKVTVELVKDEE